MVCRVVDGNGALCSLHRTYLDGAGAKLALRSAQGEQLPPRKLMPAPSARGMAVRLAEPCAGGLGVAEGVETALAAWQLSGIPTWSLLSAQGLRSFAVPEGVHHLTVFVDNDPPDRLGRRAGVDAARELMRRPDVEQRVLAGSLQVRLRMPMRQGWDIADLWQGRAGRMQASG
jgi:putative DNA primase/helicase